MSFISIQEKELTTFEKYQILIGSFWGKNNNNKPQANLPGHWIFNTEKTCEMIIDQLIAQIGKRKFNKIKKFVIKFNLEFAIKLVQKYGVDPSKIVMVGDHRFKKTLANQLGFKYYSINEWLQLVIDMKNVKKEDIVGLTNPPWDNDGPPKDREYYQKFIRQIHEVCGIVVGIYPPRWSSLATSSYRKFSNFLLDNNLVRFGWLPADTFKEQKVQMMTCFTITDTRSEYDETLMIDVDGNTRTFDLKSLGFYPQFFDNVDILAKFHSSKNIDYRAESGNTNTYENKINHGPHKIILRGGFSNEPIPYVMGDDENLRNTALYDEEKVIMSRNASTFNLGPVKVADKDSGVAFASFGLKTASRKESENLKKYLETKPIKFLVRQYKTGTKGNSKELFSHIPDVDLSVSWTDELVAKHFKLSEKQIDKINSIIR